MKNKNIKVFLQKLHNALIKKPRTALILFLIALLLSSCSRPEFSLEGVTAFSVKDGNKIYYASFDMRGGDTSFRSFCRIETSDSEDKVEVVGVYPASASDAIAITRKHGVFLVRNMGSAVERIDRGLPLEMIYPFNKRLTKPVVSHSVSAGAKTIAVIVPSNCYISTNGGKNFAKCGLEGLMRFTELLSVALRPDNPQEMLLGASGNGIFYSKDGGATISRIRTGLPGEPVKSPNFLEEVRSLCFGEEGYFYAGMGCGNGVYQGNLSRGVLEKAGTDEMRTYPLGDCYRVEGLGYYGGSLFVSTNRKWKRVIPIKTGSGLPLHAVNLFAKNDGLVSMTIAGKNIPAQQPYYPVRKFRPDQRALGKRGLYISYGFTQGGNYPKLISLLNELGLNAVIMNLKDDYGTIRVPCRDKFVTQVPGSVRPYAGAVRTIERLRRDGIYVIARMVVFKDEKLYAFDNGKYAVKNNYGGLYFKGPEKWCDAYSEFAWDYNIAAAKAMERAGADEIQFDYIRFPDVRGQEDRRRYDHQKPDQTMREALCSFLIKAREEISVPISIDLFGYNAVFKWGNWIGHDIAELSQYADAVSPMFYPSHFTGGYAAGYGKERIYYLMYLSCKRARELVPDVILRPYIQAFYYKNNEDGYCADYIGREITALKKAGLSDYIFWNDLSEFTILIRGMRKHLGRDDRMTPELKAIIPKKLPFGDLLEPEKGQ
jgi:hypothetical protein